MGWLAENFPHTTSSIRRYRWLRREQRRISREYAALARIATAHNAIGRGFEQLDQIRAEREKDPAP